MDALTTDAPSGAATSTGLTPERDEALRAWRDQHPSVDEDALCEAAASATLAATEDGPRFDDSFGELVEFIAELPF